MHRNEHAVALADFDAALAQWRGRPLGGVGGDESLDAVVTRLDEEHDAVVEDRFEVLLRLGRHVDAVVGLQEAVEERPLRERRWGQLALALYRSHRQADALRAIGTARAMLAEELGLVPGPELQALETQILAHAPELVAVGPAATPPPSRAPSPSPRPVPVAPPATPAVERLVGRRRELGLLEQALDHNGGVVTVEGDAGIGKTAMLEALAGQAAARGWSVLWGRCVEPGLAPPLWPWIEVLRALATATPGTAFEISSSLAELAMPSGGAAPAANLVEVADDLVRELAAGEQPRLIVLDDLQWADAPSLDLMGLVIQLLGDASVVVAVGHRPANLATLPALASTLAAVTRCAERDAAQPGWPRPRRRR